MASSRSKGFTSHIASAAVRVLLHEQSRQARGFNQPARSPEINYLEFPAFSFSLDRGPDT